MRSFIRISLIAIAALVVMQGQSFAANPGWKINEPLKVQLVYLPAFEAPASQDQLTLKPLLGHIPSFKPDIDNIVYKNIRDLGFPLPNRDNAASLKLYLKLFAWPESLDASRSTHKIFDDFLLYQVEGTQRLYDFSAAAKNLAVKAASIDAADRAFDAEHPLQAPLVPRQSDFDSQISFSSIYVEPNENSKARSEADRARHSAQGVVAFHHSLLNAYTKALHPMGAAAGKRFFADFHRCPDRIAQFCGVRVYEIPESPLIFANYRELPMPSDPKIDFLSGLLLVKLTEYAARTPLSAQDLVKTPTPGSEPFNANFSPIWSHMLEVGSVFETSK